MSVTSGGTALKPLSSGGRSASSAGTAGMVITFRVRHSPFPFRAVRSRYQMNTELERSSSEITTPTKP